MTAISASVTDAEPKSGWYAHHTEGKPHQVPVKKTAKSMFQVFAQSLDFFQSQIVNEAAFCIEHEV